MKVKVPWGDDNRNWLRDDRHRRLKWDRRHRCWDVPRAWLSPVVDQVLERWGRLYLIHTYRPKEVCAPACWNAMGYDCQCSCMGENHGARNLSGRWYIASDAFAVQWGERKLAVRLIDAGGVQ